MYVPVQVTEEPSTFCAGSTIPVSLSKSVYGSGQLSCMPVRGSVSFTPSSAVLPWLETIKLYVTLSPATYVSCLSSICFTNEIEGIDRPVE